MGLTSASDVFFLLLKTSLLWMVCFVFIVTLTRRQLTSVKQTVNVDSSTSRYYFYSGNVSIKTISTKLTDVDICDDPLLTLYTTFRSEPQLNISNTNVILNWAELLPCVQPLLFIQDNTDPSIIRLAQEHSWLIEPVPNVSPIGVPIFKDMYYKARELVNSQFHGYSNGDILYSSNLVATLQAAANTQASELNVSCMIIGRRKNANITDILYQTDDVAAISAPLDFFSTNAVDYFLISLRSFPWQNIPDLVVGRPGYDNFLVATAISGGVSVIDASNTIEALHQSLQEDAAEAAFARNDAFYNLRIIGQFPFHLGYTSCAQTRTKWDKERENVLIEINPDPPCITTLTPESDPLVDASPFDNQNHVDSAPKTMLNSTN